MRLAPRALILGLALALPTIAKAAISLYITPSFDGIRYSEWENGDKPISPCTTPSGWTLLEKGDGAGLVCENSSSEFEISASGTNDEGNQVLAYQSCGTADCQIIATIPATSAWTGHTENFTGFGVGFTEGTADADWYVHSWTPFSSAAPVCKWGTPGPDDGNLTGIADSPPVYVALTHLDASNVIECWQSADGSTWDSTGEISKNVAEPLLAYVWGTSHLTGGTTTATLTNIAFSTTVTITGDDPPPPPTRTGIFLEASGETLTPCSNCQASDLNSNAGDSVDGFRVKHLANAQYYSGAVPAVVQALDHWSILVDNSTVGADSNVDSADGDNRFFRGTLYPEPYDPPGGTYGSTDLAYGPLNGNASGSDPTKDKPRIDFLMKAAAGDIHNVDETKFADRNDHWLSFGVYLPSDYEEECSGGWQEAVLQYVSQYTTPNNQFALDIEGSSSCSPANAEWIVERWVADPGASSGVKTGSLGSSTPVTNAMKGAWTFHTFLFNIDNRTSGATPKFEWWVTDEACAELHHYVDNSSRWGFDSSGAAYDYPNWNQVYKGGWHDATSGTYDGPKDAPVQMGFDAFRMGDSTSSFADVHPLGCAEP